jgi:hypothetical protein
MGCEDIKDTSDVGDFNYPDGITVISPAEDDTIDVWGEWISQDTTSEFVVHDDSDTIFAEVYAEVPGGPAYVEVYVSSGRIYYLSPDSKEFRVPLDEPFLDSVRENDIDSVRSYSYFIHVTDQDGYLWQTALRRFYYRYLVATS